MVSPSNHPSNHPSKGIILSPVEWGSFQAPLPVIPTVGRNLKSIAASRFVPDSSAQTPQYDNQKSLVPGQAICEVPTNTYRHSREGGNPSRTWPGKHPFSSELHHFAIVLFPGVGPFHAPQYLGANPEALP